MLKSSSDSLTIKLTLNHANAINIIFFIFLSQLEFSVLIFTILSPMTECLLFLRGYYVFSSLKIIQQKCQWDTFWSILVGWKLILLPKKCFPSDFCGSEVWPVPWDAVECGVGSGSDSWPLCEEWLSSSWKYSIRWFYECHTSDMAKSST